MMSTAMALAELPPKLRGHPAVEGIVDSLVTSRRKNTELREVAKQALSPGRTSVAVQGGAVVNGAVRAFVGEQYAGAAQLAAIATLFGLGLYLERADLVSAANGCAAPWTAQRTYELLTRAREGIAQQQGANQAPQQG